MSFTNKYCIGNDRFLFSLFSNKKRYDFPVYLYQCNAFACILL